MFCREQVAQLRDVVDKFRSLGADLVVVGNGRPEHAVAFKSEQNLTFPVLVDPSMEAYRAAGLRRGVGSTLNLKTLWHAVGALRKGFRQSNLQGDAWQLGGAFVIAPGDTVLFDYINRDAGDHPDPRDMLAVLERIKSN